MRLNHTSSKTIITNAAAIKLSKDFVLHRYFATPQLTITSILAKHARSLTENGQRVYVAKHS